jgi:hypothetical protein
MVWDRQLDVQGFEQEAYEQLLDISSAFLETVQATALGTVRAVAEGEELVGRQAATASDDDSLAPVLHRGSDRRASDALPAFASMT